MQKHNNFWRECDGKKVAGNARHLCFVNRNVLSCAQCFAKETLRGSE